MRIYDDMGNAEDSFGCEEIVEGEEMRVTIGAEAFFCRDDVEEKDAFAITNET